MSDWVASLIDRATHELQGANEVAEPEAKAAPPSALRATRQKVARVPSPAHPQPPESAKTEEAELAQMYTAPPFWACDARTNDGAAEQHGEAAR